MLFATTEELELRGIFCQEKSQILFQNKLFTRVSDFPKDSRQAAIKFCHGYLSSKLLCLIVESKTYFTVWIEEKEAKPRADDENFIRNFAKPKSNSFVSSTEIESDVEEVSNWGLGQRKFSTEPASEKSEADFTSSQSLAPSPFKNQSSKDVLSESHPKEDKTSSNSSNQTSNLGEVDTPPSSEPSPNQQASSKKRTKRKYRGISY